MAKTEVPSRETETRHSASGNTCHHFQRFGLSCDEYDLLRKRSENRCEICRTPEAEMKRPLVIDHFESPDLFFVRGLLCQRCNCVMSRHDRNVEWGPATLPWARKARAYHLNSWQRMETETFLRVEAYIASRVPWVRRIGGPSSPPTRR